MNSTGKYFKKFDELNNLAWGFAPGDGGPYQSRPVPVRRQNQAVVAFMFCPQWLISGPAHMEPPSMVGWLDPVTGERIAKARVSPAYFGRTDAADKFFPAWELNLPKNTSYDEFTNLKKRLYELYDALFPVWAGNISTSGQPRLQAQAREFLKLFGQISEPPLHPYYEALGHDYFGWVRKLAG